MKPNGFRGRTNRSAQANQAGTTTGRRQQTAAPKRRQPVWKVGPRSLSVDGIVLHEFHGQAAKLLWLLTFFQEQKWSQEWFDDPLPGTPNGDAPQRLKDAVRALNQCQRPQRIRFRTRDKFTMVRWEWVDS